MTRHTPFAPQVDVRSDRHIAGPERILAEVLKDRDIDRFGLRLSLWSGFYVGPAFAEIERRHGLARDENNVLFALSVYGQLTASSIALFLGRPKNSISRAVERLIRKRLITSSPDPVDGRRSLLKAEPQGRDLHKATLAIHKEREALMLNTLTDEERAILDIILDKMMSGAGDWMISL